MTAHAPASTGSASTGSPSTGSTPAGPRRARVLRAGPVVLGLTAAICAAAVLIDLQVPAAHRELVGLEPAWTAAVTALVMAWAGATVLGRDPRHPVGWLLSGFGVWWALDALASAWLGLATHPNPVLPGAALAFGVSSASARASCSSCPLLLLLSSPTAGSPQGQVAHCRGRRPSSATALLPVVLLTGAVPSSLAREIDR